MGLGVTKLQYLLVFKNVFNFVIAIVVLRSSFDTFC